MGKIRSGPPVLLSRGSHYLPIILLSESSVSRTFTLLPLVRVMLMSLSDDSIDTISATLMKIGVPSPRVNSAKRVGSVIVG
jgi:hypothetical protein